MMTKKLTKAQRAVFDTLVATGKFNCISSYAPAVKLVELGYATMTVGRYGGSWLEPTAEAKARAEDERLARTTQEQPMNISKKRAEELQAIPDDAIDASDIPEQGEEFFRNAKLKRPGEPLAAADDSGEAPKPR